LVFIERNSKGLEIYLLILDQLNSYGGQMSEWTYLPLKFPCCIRCDGKISGRVFSAEITTVNRASLEAYNRVEAWIKENWFDVILHGPQDSHMEYVARTDTESEGFKFSEAPTAQTLAETLGRVAQRIFAEYGIEVKCVRVGDFSAEAVVLVDDALKPVDITPMGQSGRETIRKARPVS
jgi:hypothetical protein